LKQLWQHGTAVDRRANAAVTVKAVTLRAVTAEKEGLAHLLLSRNPEALTSEYFTYLNILLLFVQQQVEQ
jgi:hypothetical protein